MLSYITVGANDLPSSGRFYAAILTPLGYEKKEAENSFGQVQRPRCRACHQTI